MSRRGQDGVKKGSELCLSQKIVGTGAWGVGRSKAELRRSKCAVCLHYGMRQLTLSNAHKRQKSANEHIGTKFISYSHCKCDFESVSVEIKQHLMSLVEQSF